MLPRASSPMELPWDSRRTPAGLSWLVLWDFHGVSFPAVLPWDPHGTPIGAPEKSRTGLEGVY